MDRSQKEELVQSLRDVLQNAAAVVVVKQTGLTVLEVTDLRRAVRASGAGFKVVKNNLAKLAIKGTPYERLSSMLVGPTALAFSADPVAAAKAVVKYAESNDKLSIVGGIMGEKMLDAAAVIALAKLPSLDELRAKLLGVLVAPASKIARILAEPGTRLVRILKARA